MRGEIMQVNQVSVKRIFNLGNYENIAIEVQASIIEQDQFDDSPETIAKMLDKRIIQMRDAIIEGIQS
jgi:hypothetical protein